MFILLTFFIFRNLPFFTGQLSASFSGLQETLRDLEMLSKNEISPEKRDENRE